MCLLLCLRQVQHEMMSQVILGGKYLFTSLTAILGKVGSLCDNIRLLVLNHSLAAGC